MSSIAIFKGQRKADFVYTPVAAETSNRARVIWDETTIKKKDLLVLLENLENQIKNLPDWL
jgi:hypothetical protein